MFARLHPIPNQSGKKLINLAVCCALLPLVCCLPTAAAEETTAKDAAQPASKSCTATLAITYQQRNTIANVEGTIENTMCAASGGDYELAISLKAPDGGDPKVIEFSGKWQRSDSQSVKFTTDYPIGENAELLRVRARKVHCTCTDAAAN